MKTGRGGRDHGWGICPHPQKSDDPLSAAHAESNSGFFTGFGILHLRERAAIFNFTEIAPRIYSYISGGIHYRTGDPRPDEKIYAIEHDVKWVAGSPIVEMESATYNLITSRGELPITIRPLKPKYFIRSAGYQGCDGWFQGSDQGENWFAHDTWDLTDAETVRKYSLLGGFFDHVVEIECNGEKGFGGIEYLVTPGYYKYAELFR